MSRSLQRYSRQIALACVGARGQERLLERTAVLIGCGALGTVLARYLVGAGIGRLRIVDRDCVEENNLQRQILFDETDVKRGLPKAVAARRKLSRVNSSVAIEAVVADLEGTNAERLLAGADVILDGTDNFETRLLINDFAVREHLPWVYSGIVATYGQTLAILPGESACLRCYLPQTPAAGELPSCESDGVLGPVAAITAGTAAVSAMRLLLGTAAERLEACGTLTLFDCWAGTTDRVRVDRRAGCTVCFGREFDYLEGNASSRATALCGREAVQVSPGNASHEAPSFSLLAERLKGQGRVSFNRYVLQFQTDDYEISLFTDARAIVKGTADPALARSLYARFIGT